MKSRFIAIKNVKISRSSQQINTYNYVNSMNTVIPYYYVSI